MADLGLWRSVRPLVVGLAVGLATVALTGSTATATGSGTEQTAAAPKVKVMGPVQQQAPCACENQVGALLAGKPRPVAPGGRTRIAIDAWGKGVGQVGGTVNAAELPKGWQVTPASRSYTVKSGGSATSKRLTFEVVAPAAAKPGTYTLVFRTIPFSGTDSPRLEVALTVR
ncbi:hypothetical protein [Flindersiella endophytica]